MSDQPEKLPTAPAPMPPLLLTFEIPQPMPRPVEALFLAQMVFQNMEPEVRLAAVNWLIDYYALPVRGMQT